MANRHDVERSEPSIAYDDVESLGSVAVILRETREGFGEDLPAVAQALRIRLVYLQAIEDGRFDDLPGHTYAVGFVRTYADYLGLDGEEMVQRFKDEARGLERKSELVFPTPVPEGKVPGGAIILVSLLLVAFAYGGWYYLSDRGQTVVDLIPDVPQQLQDLLNSDDTTGEVDLAAADPQPQAADPVEPQAVSSEAPDPVTPDPATPEPAVSDPVLPDDSPSVAETEDPVDQANAVPDPEAVIETAAEPQSPPEPQVQVVAGEALVADESRQNGEAATGDLAPVGSLAEVLAVSAPAAQEQDPGNPAPVSLVGETVTTETSSEAAASDGADIPAAPEATQLANLDQGRTPRVYGADNANPRIVLRAKYDSWVQVRDGQDALLLTRVLRAGDSYRVPNQAGLTLLTGNAGGLEIVVDGQQMAPLGPIGSVRRNIQLDPGRLVDGSAVPQ